MNYVRFFESSASVLPKLERSTTKGVFPHSLRHLFLGQRRADAPPPQGDIVPAVKDAPSGMDDGQLASISTRVRGNIAKVRGRRSRLAFSLALLGSLGCEAAT